MHLKTLKMIATSGFLRALECTKFVFENPLTVDKVIAYAMHEFGVLLF